MTQTNAPPPGRPSPAMLGLMLGAAVILFIAILVFVFSRTGLPKDPKEWRRIEQHRSAMEAKP